VQESIFESKGEGNKIGMVKITQLLFLAYCYHAIVIEELEILWGYRTSGFILKRPQEMNACLRLRKMSHSYYNLDLQT
jgi:hypothetical protein